jgi:hypothetical protein
MLPEGGGFLGPGWWRRCSWCRSSDATKIVLDSAEREMHQEAIYLKCPFTSAASKPAHLSSLSLSMYSCTALPPDGRPWTAARARRSNWRNEVGSGAPLDPAAHADLRVAHPPGHLWMQRQEAAAIFRTLLSRNNCATLSAWRSIRGTR